MHCHKPKNRLMRVAETNRIFLIQIARVAVICPQKLVSVLIICCMFVRSRQWWITWISALVMALSVLAPTVSRTLESAGVASGLAICTPSGMQLVKIDDAGLIVIDQDPDSDGAMDLDSCPLCILLYEALLSTAPQPVSPVFAVLRTLRLHRIAVALSRPTLVMPPSRGPPSLAFPILSQ